MAERETSSEIETAATEWAVRVDAGDLSPADRASLDAWLGDDIRRLGAFARARAVFAHARRAKALGADFDPDAFVAGADGEPLAGVVPLSAAAPERGPGLSRRRLLAIGGSAAAAGIVAAVGLSWPAAAQTYRTAKGEVRRISLEDGSALTLNTASEVRVRYGASARDVDLVEGEALFEVARDPARPFTVRAGDTAVRAVGTSFTVRSLAGRPVQVVVRQGVVEVARPSEPAAPPQRIAANMRLVAAPEVPLVAAPVPPEQVDRTLAWREGMLAFEDMPLAEAAAEFARYGEVRISFADPAIGRETVTGLYAANNPRGFARSAALSLGLQAREGPGGVVLSR